MKSVSAHRIGTNSSLKSNHSKEKRWMNTSRSTPRLSKPVANEPVPSPALEYMRRRNRRRFFSLVHQELKRSGISRLELSKRMGRGMDRISHLLAAPGNWRLDTLSD